jgi:hypothetical protein
VTAFLVHAQAPPREGSTVAPPPHRCLVEHLRNAAGVLGSHAARGSMNHPSEEVRGRIFTTGGTPIPRSICSFCKVDSQARTSTCCVTVAVVLGSEMGTRPSPRGLMPRRDAASRFFTQIHTSSVFTARSMIAASEGSVDRGGRIHGHASESDADGGGDMELPSSCLRFVQEPDP